MHLSNNGTPKEVISYAEYLAGGMYGENVVIKFTDKNILFNTADIPEGIKIFSREVCGYVAYILAVGLTNFPGNSEKDYFVTKNITPEIIKSFKKRTDYLLTQSEARPTSNPLKTKKTQAA